MQLPILAPAPLVGQHAAAFEDLFENRKQYRHFQNYLTGLMVLPNKSMANISLKAHHLLQDGIDVKSVFDSLFSKQLTPATSGLTL